MNHADHVNLIKEGITQPGGLWADFGSGAGAFTLALVELIGPSGEIFSIDKDKYSLNRQQDALESKFPKVLHPIVHYLHSDFTISLDLPPLDGCIIANALHFQPAPATIAQQLRDYLRPCGRFIIVEYNITVANPWVPHPVPFQEWQGIAARAGFQHTQLLASRPSRTFHEIYAALSINSDS